MRVSGAPTKRMSRPSQEIAKELDTTVKVVRGWLGKGKTKKSSPAAPRRQRR